MTGDFKTRSYRLIFASSVHSFMKHKRHPKPLRPLCGEGRMRWLSLAFHSCHYYQIPRRVSEKVKQKWLLQLWLWPSQPSGSCSRLPVQASGWRGKLVNIHCIIKWLFATVWRDLLCCNRNLVPLRCPKPESSLPPIFPSWSSAFLLMPS